MAEGHRLADRIVAVVDEDPILASEIDRAIVIGSFDRRPGESDEELERRVLDALIDRRLRMHEVERFGTADPTVEEVDEQVSALEERLGGSEALDRRLAAVAMDRQGLRSLLAQQLRLLAFIRERLGPRVFIGLEEIQRYYDTELPEQLSERSTPDSPIERPPIEEVREEIRAVLYQRALDREIEEWTRDLRLKADVRDLLEVPAELPPVVDRRARPPGSG
jgi:hypothetical protein